LVGNSYGTLGKRLVYNKDQRSGKNTLVFMCDELKLCVSFIVVW